ncbi:MAG: fatty acyl-AMP ligase [Deltaproteobacteria bacterium]|nr:MAG: fatty acyl-AMP ligase [Deltaproteobacteria bacterium]
MRTVMDLLDQHDPRRGLFLYSSLIESPEFLSYRDLRARACVAVASYRAQGLAPGDRVIFPFHTSLDAIASFLAIVSIGALPFSVKTALKPGAGVDLAFLEVIARRYRATYAAGLGADDARALALRLLVSGGAVDGAVDRAPGLRPGNESDLLFVQFSSGSTSFPKGVPVTHGGLMQQLAILTTVDDRREGDVYASWLPLYHDMGLIAGMLTSLYAGNDLHLMPPLEFVRDPMAWLGLLSRVEATHTITPYFGINHCTKQLVLDDAPEIQKWDFRKLRSWFVGSDPTDYDVMMAFQKLLEPRGLRAETLLPCYGMAEAVLMVSGIDRAERPKVHVREDGRKFVSVGRLVPGFEARITREDGTICKDGELGEIELRGATMVGRYFEDSTVDFFNEGGYFQTGDIGYLISGEIYIAGRIGDRIKVNGQTLVSNEFELAVEALAFVRAGKSVVFQIEDRIMLLVEVPPEEAKAGRRRELIEAIVAQLGVKLRLADVLFIRSGQLKKTSSGKLRRRVIAEAYLRNEIRFIETSDFEPKRTDHRKEGANV